MEFSNKNRIRKTRIVVNFIAAFLFLLILFFIWKEMDVAAVITGIVLVLYLVSVQMLNLNYFFYSSADSKVVIRFYPAITFFHGLREYQVIEFDSRELYRFELKKNIFFFNLYLEVHARNGIAEYPVIELSGLSEKEIEQLRADLIAIMRHND